MHRYNTGELTSADSIHFPDSLMTYTLRLKRPVYGGGGIMPDFFVPLDTMKYTKYHRELSARGCLVQVSLRYLDEHREELLANYSSLDDFDANFEVDDEFLAMLRKQGEEDGVTLEGREEEYERALPELKLQLKLFLARDLWDMSDFMMLYNRTSDIFLRAYELVQQKNQDKLLLK